MSATDPIDPGSLSEGEFRAQWGAMRDRLAKLPHPKQSCGGVDRFPSRAAAKRYIEQAAKVDVAIDGTYCCSVCGGWHLINVRPAGWKRTSGRGRR
jgi:hypothetical protein